MILGKFKFLGLGMASRQLLHEPKAVIGERSQADLSSAWEGNTYLPSQTLTQPGNARSMNGMMVTRTASLA